MANKCYTAPAGWYIYQPVSTSANMLAYIQTPCRHICQHTGLLHVPISPFLLSSKVCTCTNTLPISASGRVGIFTDFPVRRFSLPAPNPQPGYLAVANGQDYTLLHHQGPIHGCSALLCFHRCGMPLSIEDLVPICCGASDSGR